MNRRAVSILVSGGLMFITSVQEALPQTNPQVTLLPLSVKRLVEGDGLPRTITVEAIAPKQATVNLKVQYWPQNAEFNSPGEPFIPGFSVKDKGQGFVKALLPNPFDKVGRYLIFADGGRNALRLIHQPKGLAAKLLALPDRAAQALIDMASGLTRGGSSLSPLQRISEKPELVAIWTARMPEKGSQITDKELVRSIGSAMMPAWSPDGNTLACAASRDDRWSIASYKFQPGKILTELWVWKSSAPHDDISPVWAPDGKAIAFVRIDGEKNETRKSDVWVLYLDSTGRPLKESRVTTLGTVQRIVGWNNEEGILFEALIDAQASDTDFMAVKVTGSSQNAVPRFIALDVPNGTSLGLTKRSFVVYANEFTDITRSFSQLEVMAEDTSHTLLTGEPALDRWPVVSPNGKYLAFDSNRPTGN